MRGWTAWRPAMTAAGILLLAVVAAAPAAAQVERLQFTDLRTAIAQNAPERYQGSFLAKVRAAEIALPPSPCAASNILGALDNQVQGLAGQGDFDTTEAGNIRAAIAGTIRQFELPPSPCGQG